MSLPLTRRIAQVALFVAAGAGTVLGASGAANAADLAQTPDLASGLSAADTSHAVNTVSGATQKAGGVATGVGNKAVETTKHVVGQTGSETAPKLQSAGQQVLGSASGAVGQTAGHLPTGQLPIGG
ncbi:ATP-binding protein [Streptomyces sp. NPDC002536]